MYRRRSPSPLSAMLLLLNFHVLSLFGHSELRSMLPSHTGLPTPHQVGFSTLYHITSVYPTHSIYPLWLTWYLYALDYYLLLQWHVCSMKAGQHPTHIPLGPLNWGQSLAHSRYPINISWVSQWTNDPQKALICEAETFAHITNMRVLAQSLCKSLAMFLISTLGNIFLVST